MTEKNLKLSNVYWFNGQNFVFGSVTIENGILKSTISCQNNHFSAGDRHVRPKVREVADNCLETIDCNGKFLIPSFTEAHMHFSTYALSLAQKDIGTIQTLKELEEETLKSISKLKEKTGCEKLCNEGHGQLPWIALTNYRANFFQGELPSKEFVDYLAPSSPLIIISFDLHSCLINERATEILTNKNVINKEDVKKGYIFEQCAFDAIALVNSITSTNFKELTKVAIRELNKEGITALQSYDGRLEHEKLMKLSKNKFFTARIMTCSREGDIYSLEKLDSKAFSKKWTNSENFLRLERGPLKLFSDGALGSQTALMSSPYLIPGKQNSGENCHNREELENYGIEVMTRKELREMVNLANNLNLPVAIHAIGDKAMSNAIQAFSLLSPERNRYLGNRIEHCQYLTDDHIDRIYRSGLSATTLACHLPYDLQPSLNLLGIERTKWLHRIADLEDKTIPFSLTCDAPVARPDPIESIYWACEGREKLYLENGVSKIYKSVTRLTALKALTSTPANMLYGKNIWGRLAPGMAADLVLLSENPLTFENILKVKVLLTIFEGKVVYERKPGQPD